MSDDRPRVPLTARETNRAMGGCIIGFFLGVLATCGAIILLTHLSFNWRP